MKKICLIYLVVLFTGNNLSAQGDVYTQMVGQAAAYVQSGQFETAQTTYENAIELDEKRSEAYMGLGSLFSLQKDWREAKNWFGEVLDRYPGLTEAHYQQGICDREDGRTRDPITRYVVWKNSKNHFQTVIEKDSLYKEVFNEYAKLRLYMSDYIEAIQLAHKQLTIKPNAPQVQLDIFSYYDFFITYGDSGITNTEDQINWLKGYNTEYAQYFIGEKYRRILQYDKADSVLVKLLKDNISFTRIPIYLSLARLYFVTGENEKAEKQFWFALNKIREFHELKFIYDDTKYIMKDSDLQTYFPTLNHIRQYYRSFWNERNPFPGYSYNLRMAEHYRRMVIAEDSYRFDGLRLRIDSPDRSMVLSYPKVFYKNDRFNDRGLVYIRYGEPDEIAKYLTGGVPNNESWLYYESGLNPKLVFHFEIHPQGRPNDWRLVPLPTLLTMVESRLGWDNRLDNYYLARTDLERASALSEIQVEAEKTIREAIERDRPFTIQSLKVIPISIKVGQFLDDLNEDYLEIFLSINQNSLKSEENDTTTRTFERGIAVQDSTWKILFKKSDPLELTGNDSSHFTNGLHIDRYTAYGKEKLLYISGHIKNKNDNQLGGYRFEYKPRPISKADLSVSDVIAAFEVTPTDQPGKMTHQGFNIIPNPTMRFDKTKLVYFYYEIYNLQMENNLATYEVRQKVVSLDTGKSIFTKFIDIFRSGGEVITISKEQQSKTSRAQEYTAFDFNDMDTGPLEIQITITDKNSGKTVEITTTFELY